MDELAAVLSVAQDEVRGRAIAYPACAEERLALEMAAAALYLAGQIVARRPRKVARAWVMLEAAVAALRSNSQGTLARARREAQEQNRGGN